MKPKQPRLSKEQMREQLRQKTEAAKLKKVVRETLFPILQEHASSIQNAERQTQIFKTVIMLIMQKPFKEKLVGDLDFSEELEGEKDEKSRLIFEAFIEGFKDVQIADAIKILQEFEGGIQAYFQNEARTRDFKTLTLKDLIGE